MGIRLEDLDDDTPPKIRLNMDNYDHELVLNASDHDSESIIFSTPSPLVLGRYAKKKQHWNFINIDERGAKRMTGKDILQTDESVAVDQVSDLIASDLSSEVLS